MQTFDAVNVEAYLGYRDFSQEDFGADYDDLTVLLAGARRKF